MVIFSDVGYPVRRVQDKGGKQVLRCDISTSEGGGVREQLQQDSKG